MRISFKSIIRMLPRSKSTCCALVVTIIIVYIMSLFNHESVITWSESVRPAFFIDQEISSSELKNGRVYLLNTSYVPVKNKSSNEERKKQITLSEFWNGKITGNPLIDNYGENDVSITGEIGRGVLLAGVDKQREATVMSEYKVNTIVSDMIPLNRIVPDSRIKGCENLQYSADLPSASVIIPFHNEWPSLLLRTVYSVINRSPRRLLKEIILVDDGSTLEKLLKPLEDYIENNFPENLVRLLRMPKRQGLINARMRGCREATGDVLVIFDSHMEVNIDWLPPLLTEVARDRTVVAMATLDYVHANTFHYEYNDNYLTRYGWDWSLSFFETFFRQDQLGPYTTSPRPGATMVGAAFAMDRKYFFELGGYDEGMIYWGGENLEMSWRVWLCGGRLLHVPCSRIGHVPRHQPYTFPGGRDSVVHFNYKRAVSVWMGDYSRFIYHEFQDMKTIDVGDISDRLALKSKLGCKEFEWYLRNVWPELSVHDENVTVWGECRKVSGWSKGYEPKLLKTWHGIEQQWIFISRVVNEANGRCLDNDNYVFQEASNKLRLQPCSNSIPIQAFSLTNDSLLRTSLQCVVAHGATDGRRVQLEDCLIGTRDKWSYTQDHSLVHVSSSLCLDIGPSEPVLMTCETASKSQKWMFKPYTFTDKSFFVSSHTDSGEDKSN